MIFQHGRYQIWNKSQHPFSHSLSEFFYTNTALPAGNVYNLQQAMDWIFAVLYPNSKAPVATPAALPLLGNTLNDYRVVNDDGDGKAASYRWEQREGEASPSWHKIYDMDWGEQSILSAFLLKTQDVYLYRHGYDDIDDTGAVITGVNGGQHLYGGQTSGKHLTFHANAGDGVGPQTGYIQFADHVRPIADSTWELGTATERFLNLWADEINVGTMNVVGGSITDSSGSISFDDENLSTNGTLTVQTMVIDTGSITDTTGTIDFDNEHLTTTGNITGNVGTFDNVQATGSASAFFGGTTIGTMVIADGSITDPAGTIDFDDEDLFTTGSVTSADGLFGDVFVSTGSIGVTTLNGNLAIAANGTGVVDVNSTLDTLDQLITGDVDQTGTATITGQLNVDNLRLDGNTLEVMNLNGNLNLYANGTGIINTLGDIVPVTLDNLGSSADYWGNLYINDIYSPNTNSIDADVLTSLRDINVGVATGMTIFWDGAKWVASVPDTEVDHGSVSGLLDDDHTQYLLLAGRAGGQTAYGGTLASQSLTLESTAHATKGSVIFVGNLVPGLDNTYDIGTSLIQVRDLYIEGQGIGFRVENKPTASLPAASAGTKGRLVYDTDEEDLLLDVGGVWRKISAEKYEITDTWDGSTSTKAYTVSGTVSDARTCIWTLYDVSGSYAEIQASITKTETQVTVTVISPLPAGSYRLVGIG